MPLAVFRLARLALLLQLGLHFRLEPLAQLLGIPLRLLLQFPARPLRSFARAPLGRFPRLALLLELARQFGFQPRFCLGFPARLFQRFALTLGGGIGFGFPLGLGFRLHLGRHAHRGLARRLHLGVGLCLRLQLGFLPCLVVESLLLFRPALGLGTGSSRQVHRRRLRARRRGRRSWRQFDGLREVHVITVAACRRRGLGRRCAARGRSGRRLRAR